MADEVKLDLKIIVPVSLEPAGDQPEKWAETLSANAQRIYDRLMEVLPDEGEFQHRLAEVASPKWKPMIDAAFVSQAGKSKANVVQFHYKKMAEAFTKFVQQYGRAFATVDGVFAKWFKDQVSNAKDRWAIGVANGPMRLTGDRIRGLVLPQIAYWMTGDPLANKFTKHVELIDGGPYDFTKAGLRQQFRSGVTNLLIASGMYILRADMEAGEIAAQNDRLVDLANSFAKAGVKPFVVGGGATDSLLEYEFADPEFKLHARIVLV